MTDDRRRILITGAAGFLGEATLDIVTRLESTEVVAALDLKPAHGPPGETRRFISVVRDIRSPLNDLLESYQFDAVIHLAFILRPPRDETEARRVNVDATRALLESCEKAGVRQLIYLSSATVYGAHDTYTRPYTEEDPVNPVKGFTYSEHKVEAERLFMGYAERNPEAAVAILRGCVIMAPGADNFIADSLGMRVLPAPAGADPEMQFLHIDDYASAVEAALTKRAKGIYNIAGSGTVRWREMVHMAGGTVAPAPASVLRGITALSWSLGLQKRSPGAGINFIQRPWLVSTDKIEREIGWKPRYSSVEALKSWTEPRRRR